MKSTIRNAFLVLIAVVLGFVSPWLASPDDRPMLYLWFNWLPTQAAQWFVGDEWAELALDVSVLASQYLALFAVVGLLRTLGEVLRDLVRSYRRRGGQAR